MKNPIYALLVGAAISCNAPNETVPDIEGAYTMLSYAILDGADDQVYNDIKQLKIYTDKHVMYVRFDNDSVSSFGVGTYVPGPGSITENIFYRASDSVINNSGDTFTLEVEMTDGGYKQKIHDQSQGKKVTSLEEYEYVGTATPSVLEGVWKQIKAYNVNGNDTIPVQVIQYKTYCSGHFMYGQTYRDALGKVHTGMGFGDFEMKGDNKVRAMVKASSYNTPGQLFDIDIEFYGQDEFKQIISEPTGGKYVEIYQRVKA